MPVVFKQKKAPAKPKPKKTKEDMGTTLKKELPGQLIPEVALKVGGKGGQAFKRIYDLGEEKVGILNQLFLEGKSIPKIMETLTQGWGVFTDIGEQTLSKYLYRYKWEVVDKGLVMTKVIEAGARAGDKRLSLVQEALEDVNILTDMHELVVVQKARVAKLLKREHDMPMLFNSLGGEMKTLAAFIGQFAELSFDLGMIKRVPSVHKITKDGHLTTVESEGRDHVNASVLASKEVEDAAKDFFAVLEAAEQGGPDGGTSVH